MGSEVAPGAKARLSRYLLDTTVLIAHLRGDQAVTAYLLDRLAKGHQFALCCVNIAELERGLRPAERRTTSLLMARLGYLVTTREAAARAGRYQAAAARHGRTLHMADALIAGTARAHGAIVLTDNKRDFAMRDLRVEAPPSPASP